MLIYYKQCNKIISIADDKLAITPNFLDGFAVVKNEQAKLALPGKIDKTNNNRLIYDHFKGLLANSRSVDKELVEIINITALGLTNDTYLINQYEYGLPANVTYQVHKGVVYTIDKKLFFKTLESASTFLEKIATCSTKAVTFDEQVDSDYYNEESK